MPWGQNRALPWCPALLGCLCPHYSEVSMSRTPERTERERSRTSPEEGVRSGLAPQDFPWVFSECLHSFLNSWEHV